MKRCITLLSLGLCLAVPMLSQASDIKPFMISSGALTVSFIKKARKEILRFFLIYI